MLRTAILAALVAAGAAAPALAQPYPPGPPPDYYRAPPPEWDRWNYYHRLNERRRIAFYNDWRQHRWRCDHGDPRACGWLDAHRPG